MRTKKASCDRGRPFIQTIGRAARNVNGIAALHADKITDSLKSPIDETNRRRPIQEKYNEEHGIEPATVIRSMDSNLVKMSNRDYFEIPGGPSSRAKLYLVADEEKAISRLTREMKHAAKNLDFEKAAEIRDKLRELKEPRTSFSVRSNAYML